MKLIVQQRERALFLRRDEQWTPVRSEAAEFNTVVEAIVFCIHCDARETKLVGKNEAGKDVYVYPFGGDPVVKAERKKLRKGLRESRWLKAERRIIRTKIDMIVAARKEMMKQLPFPSKRAPTED